jgi:hypothetical protein
MIYENNCLYESHCTSDISLSEEIIGTSLFTISMVGLILFVLTAFIL